MIRIADLTERDKGREVRYREFTGMTEYGKIASWNHTFIFVHYHLRVFANGERVFRTGSTSEATAPDSLEFV